MVDKASEAMTAVERAQSSAFKFGNERTEATLRLQKELLDMCNQASRDWLTRLKSETELWTGLRSFPNLNAELCARSTAVIASFALSTMTFPP